MLWLYNPRSFLLALTPPHVFIPAANANLLSALLLQGKPRRPRAGACQSPACTRPSSPSCVRAEGASGQRPFAVPLSHSPAPSVRAPSPQEAEPWLPATSPSLADPCPSWASSWAQHRPPLPASVPLPAAVQDDLASLCQGPSLLRLPAPPALSCSVAEQSPSGTGRGHREKQRLGWGLHHLAQKNTFPQFLD